MQVLLLNASPKNSGATQEILSIVKSKLPSIIFSELLCLGDFNIAYCLGEKTCYDTCRCIHNDDMELLIEKIDKADVLIIASPSYWADVPGQFKVFIDRCTAYSDTNPNPAHRVLTQGKKCYGIALRTGVRSVECEHIIETIKHWCGHMKVDMVDSTYFCEINDKADVIKITESIHTKVNEWFCQSVSFV